MDRILSRDHVLRPLENGVAFARVVYMDYELIEKHVEMSYHPQNSFCFAIDKKAAKEFKERMQAMASCLPNVLLLPGRFFKNPIRFLFAVRAVSFGSPKNGFNWIRLEGALSPDFNALRLFLGGLEFGYLDDSRIGVPGNRVLSFGDTESSN